MKNKSELKAKRKGKRKMGWIIALIIIAVLVVGGAIACSYFSK